MDGLPWFEQDNRYIGNCYLGDGFTLARLRVLDVSILFMLRCC